MRFAAIATALTILAGWPSIAGAVSVLYDNGPVNGTINAAGISSSQAIANTFTLAAASTVTGVTFGVWNEPGTALHSVDWGITATFGALPQFSTATVTSGPVTGHPYGFYDLRSDAFSTGRVFLAAGTYYLWIGNSTTGSPGVSGNWDVNNGASLAYFATNGVFNGPVTGIGGPGRTGSSAFQVLGQVGSIPEPVTWVMMLIGFTVCGAALRTGTPGRAAAGAASVAPAYWGW